MLIEYDGRLRRWESFASGKAIYELYGKHAYDITDKRTWHHIAHTFVLGFGALIPVLQPEVIIIGGSIGTHFDKYRSDLVEGLDELLSPLIARPQFIQAAHPQEAVIYGGFHYAKQRLAS